MLFYFYLALHCCYNGFAWEQESTCFSKGRVGGLANRMFHDSVIQDMLVFCVRLVKSELLVKSVFFYSRNSRNTLGQRRLDPGKETLKVFFQVRNHKEYQNVVIVSFVHLEKMKKNCFMH